MQIAPGQAMWHYLDNGYNARGQLTSALLLPINCIGVTLLRIKI